MFLNQRYSNALPTNLATQKSENKIKSIRGSAGRPGNGFHLVSIQCFAGRIEQGRDPAVTREKEEEQHRHVGMKPPAKNTDGPDVKADQHEPDHGTRPRETMASKPAVSPNSVAYCSANAIQRCSRISVLKGDCSIAKQVRPQLQGNAVGPTWPARVPFHEPREPIKQAKIKHGQGVDPARVKPGRPETTLPRRRANFPGPALIPERMQQQQHVGHMGDMRHLGHVLHVQARRPP